MARCGKACDKKAYSDLNYVGHKTIHIDLPFAKSRESKNVKILGTEIYLTMILCWYALNVSRMLTEGVEDTSTAMYELIKIHVWIKINSAGRGFQNTPCPGVRILLMSSYYR